MELFGGLGFIYSRVSFNEEHLPFEISENLILRQATKNEADRFIEHVIKTYGTYAGFVIGGAGNLDRFKSSGEEPKKLWVIAFEGSNHELYSLGEISILIEPKILLGDTALFHEKSGAEGEYGFIFGGHRNENIMAERSRNKEGLVSNDELYKLRELHAELKKEPHLSRYLKMYASSQDLSADSKLLTLSLFSIIESLVVHKPTQIENLDSITSQVKNKVHLLSKMFDNKLDYTSYFGETTPAKVWSKMYGLRSNIAHGEDYDFSDNKTCLKSVDNINKFLDEVVRQLLRLTFTNMGLITDIKAC